MKTFAVIASLGLVTVLPAQEVFVSQSGTRSVAQAPASNFTGTARVEMLFGATEPMRASGGVVQFEAGARTNWHTHPYGQTLYVISGVGRVQVFGGPVREIKAGDTIWFPPGEKHWHGAAPETAMCHIATQEARDGSVADWMEPVTDAQYTAKAEG